METNTLISMLAADGKHGARPMPYVWAGAFVAAVIIAAFVFFLSIGPRPDIADAARTIRFLFKFVFTLTLLAVTFAALRRLAIPGGDVGHGLAMLAVVPALLLLAVAAELVALPPAEIGPRWLGSNATICMTFIPLIGIGPLLAFLAALRYGAPTRPSLSGAVAGLAAGGLAATLYAAHCTDDSPLFVATWYPLAVSILAMLGAIASRFVVKW